METKKNGINRQTKPVDRSGAIQRYALVSHARHFGMARLRESCAIATASMLSDVSGNWPRYGSPAQFLYGISQKSLTVSPEEISTLRRHSDNRSEDRQALLVMNRLVDGYEAIQKRRRGDAKPPWA